ncbi:zinc finger CCCH domain-containing protein 62-like [Cornus florida]|uniref:zinc finger CCCH domain-containing protein 62-like n=1 Tax=Cornus florida TaxID=4283 RepID=UPI00289E7B90|nr:zinc finger CCCH domain-containing protein 62-like [Cornus florida]
MGISEQEQVSDHCHDVEEDESNTEDCDSDDSQEDPTFDVLEETRSSFSRLSIKKKSKSRIVKEMDDDAEGDLDVVEMVVPELDEADQKSFEVIHKIIQVGQVDKLKVDQCKVYLRKYGLRLTGNKDTLIGRIKEHLDILNGGGEKKYPISSFVFNCKGDACMGDVVMFEQNVCEMFNIASRSAGGPPCGMRTVAGRIVKESYGAAKQQHTFTIEVLWSKGEKPLSPLHPLLIKGRNLYKLKTMRQKWEDEGERQKILFEKHSRGSLARLNRESRIVEKEKLKELKANRKTGKPFSRVEVQKGKREENKGQTFQSPQKKIPMQNECYLKTYKENNYEGFHQRQPSLFSNANVTSHGFHQRQPSLVPTANVTSEGFHQRQPLTSMNCNPPSTFRRPLTPSRGQFRSSSHEQSMKSGPPWSPLRRPSTPSRGQFQMQQGCEQSTNFNASRIPFQRENQEHNLNSKRSMGPFQGHGGPERKQLCRHYAQGRCWYGDQCKYLH